MTGTKPRPEHTHNSRASRDACAQGNCDWSTIVKTWPDTTDYQPMSDQYGSNIRISTLNNIEVTHVYIEGRGTLGLDLTTLDDFITQLEYARWYLTEGKYNDHYV